MKSLRGVLAMASVLVAGLVVVPSASAVVYANAGAFPSSNGWGVAVDQSNGDVYVAEDAESGVIRKYDSSGNLLTSFGPVGTARFSGVAVDPTDPDTDGDHNVYAYISNPEASRGIVTFDSGTGATVGSPIVPSPLPGNRAVQIAADSSGNIYFPNVDANTVQKFSPSGTLLQTITCSACPEPEAFSFPADIAVDSAGNIYVVDGLNQRLLKFGPGGDSDPSPPVVIESAEDDLFPVGVAIDPATNNLFVAHIDTETFEMFGTAYDSSGAELGDFGRGTLTLPGGLDFFEPLAVNAATGDIYVSNKGTDEIVTFTPVSPPSSVTGTASAITPTTATVAGTVNPNGSDVTNCDFLYSTDLSYDHSAPCVPVFPGAGEEPVAVSANLTGLLPNQTYHFKLVGENAGGPGEGEDATFTTSPNLPTVTTGGSSGITQTGATISGTINPGGAAVTDCHFEYGTTTAYGTSVPCPTPAGSGSSDVAQSLALGGLAPGTTYHYRLVGKNAGGTKNGNDATFTTQSAPPPPPSGGGSTPPPPSGSNPPPPKKPLKCKKGFKKKKVKGKQKCVKVKKKGKKG